MKTTRIITAVIFCLLTTVQIFAGEYQKAKESYIDDINFDTKQIYDSVMYQDAITISFAPKEESFIEDIPFETEKIAQQCNADSAMKVSYKMPEEEVINDIPFNTLYVVRQQNKYLSSLIY